MASEAWKARRHKLDAGKNPQTYGTGIKEIWELAPERGAHWLGRVEHTMGYPLGLDGYGGGWIYGLPENKLSIGYVIGIGDGGLVGLAGDIESGTINAVHDAPRLQGSIDAYQ